ncbi:MAG: ParB/RepB/Spo0J family partition protein, partial [Alphaproteobacteria bacterium]|nr:ParB/RepB/Spo0J family partition protein [Alphaproteobacteria bacterium]
MTEPQRATTATSTPALTTADTARPAPLGRGLAALFGDTPAPAGAAAPLRSTEAPRQLPISALHPSPFQPRRQFSEAELQELAASIKTHGVLQPLLVRAAKTPGQYEIIAGERRWRAAQMMGLH